MARRRRAIGARATDSERRRFFAKVDRSGGADACWPWIAGRTKDGYGRITIRSRETGAFTQMYANRVAFWIANGFFPVNALHSCHHPWCCNDRHLRDGSTLENADDAIRRGSFPFPAPLRGLANAAAKMSEAHVREIRSSGRSDAELATAFGLSRQAVSMARRRVTWKHVLP
jgi:hypothetical protein